MLSFFEIRLIFRDSLLLLPSSLRSLCKSFNVKTQKSIFPFGLNDINYKGKVPNIDLFSNLSKDDYNKYKLSYSGKAWDFKEEAIKYCKIDCISLYQIIRKFNYLVFNKFNLNKKTIFKKK